jgi:hypothetical protein
MRETRIIAAPEQNAANKSKSTEHAKLAAVHGNIKNAPQMQAVGLASHKV